jgi:hypothetical protein
MKIIQNIKTWLLKRKIKARTGEYSFSLFEELNIPCDKLPFFGDLIGSGRPYSIAIAVRNKFSSEEKALFITYDDRDFYNRFVPFVSIHFCPEDIYSLSSDLNQSKRTLPDELGLGLYLKRSDFAEWVNRLSTQYEPCDRYF